MRISRRILLSAALLALLAFIIAPIWAAETAPKYLGAGAPDPIQLLAPPPVDGSAEAVADLETTFRVYSARTPEELARSKAEVKDSVFMFAPAIGPWFVPGKFPKTEALFKEVIVEVKAVTSVGKKHWKRLRPYHVDPARFTDAVENEEKTDYGYPSGHSTRGTTESLILAEIFPEQYAAIIAKGRDTGWLRVLGGVHYPTDIYAGRVLGQALARAFLASPEFQKDLAAAKAELAVH